MIILELPPSYMAAKLCTFVYTYLAKIILLTTVIFMYAINSQLAPSDISYGNFMNFNL